MQSCELCNVYMVHGIGPNIQTKLAVLEFCKNVPNSDSQGLEL
jgi:hypothetical protein